MELIDKIRRANSDKSSELREGIKFLAECFRQYNDDKDITYEQFQRIVKSKNPFFVERMFEIFDKDGSNTISKLEFVDTLQAVVGNSVKQKLKVLFDVYDLDGDGLISYNELRHVIHSCMIENNLTFDDEQIENLTKILFEDASSNGSKALSFNEFVEMFNKRPGLSENLSISMIKWLIPPPRQSLSSNALSGWYPKKLRWKYIKNNTLSVTFFLTLVAINVGLFVSRGMQYSDVNVYTALARASQCLNFNCAFILVLVLRKSITFLRSTELVKFLPLDQHIYYHKLVGYFILFYSAIHTIMHCLNYWQISKITSISLYDILFTANLGIGWIYGSANLTGWILCVALVLMIITSLPYMRKSGHFEIFYYFHLLYFVFWIALIAHAPVFWIWFIVPCLIFIIEKIYRISSSFAGGGRTWIEKGVILPSRVIHLVVKKPSSFTFNPGDWVFVQIPHIASTEWHPFTISSAPEIDGHLWLHIRAVGGWTKALYEFFEKHESSEDLMVKNAQKDYDFAYTMIKMCELLTIPISRKHPLIAFSKSTDSKRNVRSLSMKRLNSTTFRTSVKIHDVLIDSNANECQERQNQILDHQIAVHHPKVYVLPKPEECDEISGECRRRPPLRILSSRLKDIEEAETSLYRIEPDISHTGVSLSTSILTYKDGEAAQEVESKQIVHLSEPLRVRIDGPYGSPSSYIFNTEHAVLISTGIGITPFASILQSIMIRYLSVKHKCPKCSHTFMDTTWSSSTLKLKKVDFIWLNRDQKSFEWFVNLLSDIELTQAELREAERFLDIHIYITSALDRSDMKAVGLQLALDLLYEKAERDLITGLKTRTRPGRPNWNSVFSNISKHKKGRVSVFFCGPPELGRVLHSHCFMTLVESELLKAPQVNLNE
ncbi:NADPH oxidase 5-like isoform X2 [Dinothrombium tinctorium]|uniref:NADPH oxidase 5-like isoform X2 n=1 Tax=Dinothrombium tinctorium TaxID=1965070 RepID=A0A3S3SAU1_9ACAR|nr:NADPH oxidase 5-like isoform X2 [Dinothrombium tinctorium]